MSTFVYKNDFKWVLVLEDRFFTDYYNPSSVIIDEENCNISLLIKKVCSDRGKTDLSEILDSNNILVDKQFIFRSHPLLQYSINYKDNEYFIEKVTYYNNSGHEIDSIVSKPQWMKIHKGHVADILLNKILKDYNINR
jgi:hypothetical protein